jgi:hypothetical protein
MVEVEIGGQRIDRQYGDWMHIWNQLTLTAEQERGYNKMVGQTTQLTYLIDPSFADVDSACAAADVPAAVCAPRNALPETTLYIPLQFWFCRNPGLALPLIALQYHEVKINLELRPSDEVLFAVSDLTQGTVAGGTQIADGSSVKDGAAYQKSLVAASLYVDYVFLDTDERRRMAQNPHEYLIEQLQFTGDESVGSSSNKIKLNFNHPCKEVIFVVQPDKNVDYCQSFLKNKDLNAALGAQPFNYTDAIDALVPSFSAFSGFNQLAGGAGGSNGGFISSRGLFQDPGADGLNSLGSQWGSILDTTCSTPALSAAFPISEVPDSGVSDAGAFVLAETALNMHCWGQNPVVTAKLQLNGQDRFSEREGTYFDLVQPYQHHTRNPDTGINVYSFALRPEEHQPSGTCNFSRIDFAQLSLSLTKDASDVVKDQESTSNIIVYTVNYNVLRVMGGMGGVAYAN